MSRSAHLLFFLLMYKQQKSGYIRLWGKDRKITKSVVIWRNLYAMLKHLKFIQKKRKKVVKSIDSGKAI